MPTNDIIDNRSALLVDHIRSILASTEAARFAVGRESRAGRAWSHRGNYPSPVCERIKKLQRDLFGLG